jgi:glucose/arabinose dehydrogenase
MKKYYVLLCVICTSVMCQTQKQDLAQNKKFVEAAALFKQYCASCHGADAPVFVDREWKHGSTKAELIRSITSGYPDAGMPTWGATLQPAQINELADYLAVAMEHRKSFDFKEKSSSNIFTDASQSVKLDTIAKGINAPWGMAYLPDGDLLFTDKGGAFYRVGKQREKQLIQGTPVVWAEGQGGLLDVELHPKFAENKLIYLSYSKPMESAGKGYATTAVLRAKLEGIQLSEQKDIFIAQPAVKAQYHFGSRLEFDKNGYLYVTVGDRGQHEPLLPQKLDNDCGKVHRMMDDGTVPADNPFVKVANARGTIWSYGHRNLQGMAMNPETGEIWTHEHGPRGGDEVNIAQKGKNYGWPVISYGINYNGTILTPLTKQEGMEQPLTYYVPSIAPCGATFVTGDHYPTWKGSFLIGSLRFKYLNRCVVSEHKIIAQEQLLKNIGRVRFIEMGRDGYLYIGVENPGYIFRLMPIKK